MSIIGTDVSKAVALLKRGELVAIPTETVYGLAGNGLNPDTVARIYEVKNRPSFDPMILHTYSLSAIRYLVEDIPPSIQLLANRFMPGPLSILLKKTARIPDIVTAGSPWVAVRIPNHPLSLEVLHQVDFPLAAPSANPFGYISPTTARHVLDQLGDRISYILDGGPCGVGIESTIIKASSPSDEAAMGPSEEGIMVLRVGGVPVEELEKVVGKVQVYQHSSSNPAAPGMLKSHYAPKVPLVIDEVESVLKKYPPGKIAVLAFSRPHPLIPTVNQMVLSPRADIREAAQNLFAYLRILDQLPVDIIVAAYVPGEGLGRAINDKLKRASA